MRKKYYFNSKTFSYFILFFILALPVQPVIAETRPHDIGRLLVDFKSYLNSVTRGSYNYSNSEKESARSMYTKIDRESSACLKRSSGYAACLWNVGDMAYNSKWSERWERDQGYFKKIWLLEPKAAQPLFGNPAVPGLSCATYSRGVGSESGNIYVSTTGACSSWEGTYYWNSSSRRYCKSGSGCAVGYIDTIPPPPIR